MTRAAISGDYVDLRFVKSRKVAQVVLEIPIEKAGEFVAAFGTPQPAEGVPVALARLDATPEKVAKLPRRMDELPLPQQAALMCNSAGFWTFLNERLPRGFRVESAEHAADWLRAKCKVASRAEIKPHTEAGEEFSDIRREYEAWLRHP
jgi:hypothetical protein